MTDRYPVEELHHELDAFVRDPQRKRWKPGYAQRAIELLTASGSRLLPWQMDLFSA